MTAAGHSGVVCLVMRHDLLCPMADGSGTKCALECKPTFQLMSEPGFLAKAGKDLRNRAQRRAAKRRAQK
jgi:hypothetical protein